MRKPTSVDALTEFGRVRLSKCFFMRDMLHSEIAQVHGLLNARTIRTSQSRPESGCARNC